MSLGWFKEHFKAHLLHIEFVALVKSSETNFILFWNQAVSGY